MNRAPTIFLAAGDTARNASRSGIQTTVRALARELGRHHADRVRLAFWNRHRDYLHFVPREFSLGLGAEPLRPARPLTSRERMSAIPYWFPGRPDERIPLDRNPITSGGLAGSWLLLPELLRDGDRVARFTAYARRHGMRLAAIFYDALPVQHPAFSRAEIPAWHRSYMHGLANFDLILPISEVSAAAWRECLERDGIPSPPVRTVPLGVEFSMSPRQREVPPDGEPPIRALCVSTVEPRKNHRRLCEAIESLNLPAGTLPLEIDLVGAPDPAAPELTSFVAATEGRLGGRLRWHRRCDAGSLGEFYRRADFTIYPSVAEGFGLPILESMWYGHPCICANFGAMAENARGGGCLTVDVRDPVALAGAIHRLATDDSLRRRLAHEAVQRPLRSWREYADDIVHALDEA